MVEPGSVAAVEAAVLGKRSSDPSKVETDSSPVIFVAVASRHVPAAGQPMDDVAADSAAEVNSSLS